MNCQSASKMSIQQFILLKAIWPVRGLPSALFQSEWAKWMEPSQTKQARQTLQQWSTFQEYLKSFDSAPSQLINQPFPELGIFSLVRYYQIASQHVETNASSSSKLNFSPMMTRSRAKRLQARLDEVPSTPTPVRNTDDLVSDVLGPTTPDTESSLPDLSALHLAPISPDTGEYTDLKAAEDEQIVNTALLLYLNALSVHQKLQYEWSISRRAFCLATQSKGGAQKVYEARVDGYLRSRDTKKVLGIVEVKPYARYSRKDGEEVKMQETAQMAAWISEDPPTLGANEETTRLLISQDRDEVYLIFATFNGDYVKYVQGTTSNAQHMIMREYGPFAIHDRSHMEALGILMHTFSMSPSFR
ncbi:hypothetical protein F4778DRAFT_761863 [Xylariomycetidae sp. FL2044]|nr:hypothetical protein F4778DRAFT_761863 [Xylariomycetidae sp. FL2044]